MSDYRILQIEDLSVRFTTPERVVQAVAGVDIELKAGEMLGIVGESGCGKTALALAIMGLLPRPLASVSYQSICFDNEPLPLADEEKLRRLRGRRIAMVFQEPMSSLNPVIAIGEQIAEVLRLHLRINKKAAAARAVELLNDVGIPRPDEITHSYPHQLSGGMRQRVMIAIAFSCHPAIIIADEPTTALDVTVQAQILCLLRDLREKSSTAFLFISHDLAVVAQEAQRIAIMYAGRIVEIGGTDDNIFPYPLHPYTQGLIASLPDFAAPGSGKKRLSSIQRLGTTPPMLAIPTATAQGCSFAERCSSAEELCFRRAPALVNLSPTHRVACWQHGK